MPDWRPAAVERYCYFGVVSVVLCGCYYLYDACGAEEAQSDVAALVSVAVPMLRPCTLSGQSGESPRQFVSSLHGGWGHVDVGRCYYFVWHVVEPP